MTAIGNMLWRIGDILDFDAQLAWTREAGFDGAGFHASAGAPGKWRGLEPADTSRERRVALRRELSAFSFAEIHAPFAIELTSDDLTAGIAALGAVLELAADLAVSVVTVHAQIGDADRDRDAWLGPMTDLDRQAARARTTIGLEIVDGFDAVRAWGLPHVGVTLDVGHMYAPARAEVLGRHSGIGGLIRHLGPALVHLHLHDTDGETDHFEIGRGIVDFPDIAAGLRETGYARGATLEMNPNRCSPEGIVRSAARVREIFDGAGSQ